MPTQNSRSRKPGKPTEPPDTVGYFQLFNGAIGQAVLRDLKAQFCARSPFIMGDPYATHVNVGAQDVIRYIEEQMNVDSETQV